MASLLDKVLAGVSPGSTSVRGMAKTLLASPLLLAACAGHAEADVEHLAYILLGLVDVRKAMESRGNHPDDALAVVIQLLDERAVSEESVVRTRTPRLQAVHDLAARAGGTSAGVITSVAAALPPELAFARKALEGAAHDVGPLYDGALSALRGAMSFEAWDPDLRGCMSRMQTLADTSWHSWAMSPLSLLLMLLCTRTYGEPLTARGINIAVFIKEIGAALPKSRWTREPPEGHTPGVGPALYAAILRAEHYAADDASDVRLRHVLAALHDEPELAAFVERIAG